jgi:hypothetical protein
MAETAVVHIGENSPEEVAYKLMTTIANLEGRELYGHGKNPADRKWLLTTYGECVSAVRHGWYEPK